MTCGFPGHGGCHGRPGDRGRRLHQAGRRHRAARSAPAAAGGQRGRLRHRRRASPTPPRRSRSTPNRSAITVRISSTISATNSRYYIAVGQLQVTYRPLTFLDDKTPAAIRRRSPTRCSWPPERRVRRGQGDRHRVPALRRGLWAHQEPGGDRAHRRRAARHGRRARVMPEDVAQQHQRRRARGRRRQRWTTPTSAALRDRPGRTGTPTVYDLDNGREGRHLTTTTGWTADAIRRPDATEPALEVRRRQQCRPGRPASRPPRSSRPG